MTASPAPEAISHVPVRRTWPTLATLTAATFWTVTAEMLPSGLMPAMSRDLRVSEGTIGVLVSAWAVTIAIVGVPLVRLTLRVPRTVLLIASLAVTAPANLVTALAPDFPVALAGRVVTATAHGLFWAVVVSYVATIVTPQRVGRALAIVLAGPTLAGLAGLPAAAFIAEHAGWRWVFAGLSAMLALTALTLWLILPRSRHADRRATPEPAGRWDRSARGVVFVAAGGGLVLIGHFAAFTYVTSLVTGLGDLAAGAIPSVLLALGVTGGAGVLLSGLAADRFPRASLVSSSALIASGLALLLGSQGRPPVFVAGVIAWGFAIGAFPPVLQAQVLRLSSPSFRPLAGSVIVTVLNLGVAVGATLGGLVLPLGSTALVLTALLAASTGALALALSSTRLVHSLHA
ncbi:MAG: MFS transporter [Microbacterium enclense]